MDTRLGRRGVLAAGVAVAVSGCTSGPESPAPRPPASASSSSASAAAASAGRVDWSSLARHVSGTLALPGSTTYDTVRLTQNPRYDSARPRAVLSVASAADVSTAFAFAQDHAVPVAVRSGGHSYPGWSSGNDELVIDVRPLSRVRLDGTRVTVGAGASLVSVYDALGSRGRGIAAGSCPTVGIAGLTLGGGVGVLTRAHGLTCDAVTSMQVVLADGRVVTASADSEPDLYWALRGGGGGHLGVVTSFTLATFAAPTMTTAYLAWPLSAAGQVVPAWLAAAPTADRRLWSTLKLLGGSAHPDGPVLFASAAWAGPASGLDAALAPLLSAVPAPSTDSRHTRGYRDTMLSYAGCSTIPVAACHTGPGGSLPREAFAATSHVVTSASADVPTLLARVQAAQGSGLTEAGVSLDALGGAVDRVGATDTAFGHRGALASVQYTATYSGDRASRAQGYVDAFRAAMTPSWGEGAYVNYAQAGLADYRTAYFGDNAARLTRVRRAYDPHHFFTQPQDW